MRHNNRLLLCLISLLSLSTTLSANDNHTDDLIGNTLDKGRFKVIDQHGKTLNFYSDLIAKRNVAINFIYTTCTSTCPLSTLVFRHVQKTVGKTAVQLISISVDPDTDTPERLLAYSQKMQAGTNWSFITGDKVTLNHLQKILGNTAVDKVAHSTLVIVGNAKAHHWLRLLGFPTAQEISQSLKQVDLGNH
jgi:protein SCO1